MKWISFFNLAVLAFSTPSALASGNFFEPAYDENPIAAEWLLDESLEAIDTAVETEPQFSASNADVNRAEVVVIINKAPYGSTAQTMRVYQNGELIFNWKVSTGREKMETAKSGRVYRTTTPVGYFRPTKLVKSYHSNTWKAEMPHSVFFVGGIAIHASGYVKDLGKRASGGCIRLAPENAEIFFNLIQPMPITLVDSINRSGKTQFAKNGAPIQIKNRDVLIIVENRI